MLFSLPFLMGSRCSPTHRARSYGCPGGPASCSSTTLPACINLCAPQPTAAAANGARCVLDPCDQMGLAQPNTFLCPENFSCMPNAADPGFGNCRITDAQVLMGCDSMDGPPCPTGTYCRPFGGGFNRPGHITNVNHDGACVPPVREGGLCDSDFGETGLGLLQCEPGTNCIEDPSGATPTRRCRRPCTSDADCPCERRTSPTPAQSIECIFTGAATGWCNACSPTRGACDFAAGGLCCDPLATCQQITIGGLTQPVCCRPNGTGSAAACTTDADCCPSSRCASTPSGLRCTACSPPGSAPGAAGCCPGSSPGVPFGGSSTVCMRPCTAAGVTYTNGAACPIGAGGCQGTARCFAAGLDCVPPTGLPATDTTCNNVDDDCDGARDEDFSAGPCNAAIPTCTNPGGPFIPSTSGRLECVGGAPSCTYEEDDYCQFDSIGELIHGNLDDCFVAADLVPNPCTASTCGYGEVCGPMGGGFCDIAMRRDGCCEGTNAGVPWYGYCCRENSARFGQCWNP